MSSYGERLRKARASHDAKAVEKQHKTDVEEAEHQKCTAQAKEKNIKVHENQLKIAFDEGFDTAVAEGRDEFEVDLLRTFQRCHLFSN